MGIDRYFEARDKEWKYSSVQYKKRIKELEEVLLKAQEWFAQYPFNNAKFERETANELYDEISTVLSEIKGVKDD